MGDSGEIKQLHLIDFVADIDLKIEYIIWKWLLFVCMFLCMSCEINSNKQNDPKTNTKILLAEWVPNNEKLLL